LTASAVVWFSAFDESDADYGFATADVELPVDLRTRTRTGLAALLSIFFVAEPIAVGPSPQI
jgi:hypothetical protein